MLIDARTLPSGARLKADIVVVGAGPIGMALAQEFAAAGLAVVQLESGGMRHAAAANALSEPAEIRFGGLRGLGHSRQVGGNAHVWRIRTGTTHWGVRLLPMNAADFEGRPGDPGSEWPFRLADLASQLARAQRYFGLPDEPDGYEASRWAHADHDLLPDDPEIRSGVFQFADGDGLVRRAMRDIGSSSSIQLVHSATVVEVLTNPDASAATGVRAVSAPGRDLVVAADHVVLAAGAMACTQLLLASNAMRPEGLGNREDLVGRYFMDHPLLWGGEIWPSSPQDFARRGFYDLRVVDGTPVMGHLQLTDDVIRKESLANLSLLLYPRENVEKLTLSRRQQSGVTGALGVRESLLRGRVPGGRDVRRFLSGADGVIKKVADGLRRPKSHLERGGWAGRPEPKRGYDFFEVVHMAEQLPHKDNRITLSGQRDPLGLRRIVVENVIRDADMEGIRRSQEVFARALSRAGWGEFRIADIEGRPIVRSATSHHFMGTTRMHRSPRLGVVDADGRVHGTPNLVVASSSVFPSGGFANVTLTALAVALRSADALIAEIRAGKSSVSN